MAGIACLESFVVGGAALGCLVLADLPRLRAHAARFVVLLVCCGAGYGAAVFSVPERPDLAAPGFEELLHGKARIEGRVARVEGMPDYRLRVFLEAVRLADVEGASPAPGLVALTWQDAPVRPLPGQTLSAEVRLRLIGGFKNPGTYDSEEFWGNQDAWLRGWMRGLEGKPKISGEGNLGTRLRENIRSRLVEVLASRDATHAVENGRAAAGHGRAEAGERAVSRSFPVLSPGAAAVPALLLNDRFYLRTQDMDILARATLVHSLALSGMHLGLAGLLGAWLALGIGWLWPGIYTRVASRRRLALLLALPFALFYIWLGGAPVSLVRAGLMLFFAGAFAWTGRPRALLDGLFLALLCLLLYSPLSLFDLRLQLSAIAIAGIALCLPLLSVIRTWWDGLRIRRAARRRGRSVAHAREGAHLREGRLSRFGWAILNLFVITMAVQTIQMPLVAHAFGFMGLSGALNIIWLPLLGAIAMPAAALGLAIMNIPGLGSLAYWAFKVCALCTGGLGQALAWLDAHGALAAPQLLRPLPGESLGYWALIAAAALLWQAHAHHQRNSAKTFSPPRHGLALLALGVCFLFWPVTSRLAGYLDKGVTLTLIDVSQGQSVLLEQGAHRLLLDAGGVAPSGFDTGKAIVAPVLTLNRPPRLDYAVYSHPDVDHARGLVYILEHFAIGRAAGNGGTPSPLLLKDLEKAFSVFGVPPESWHAGQTYPLAPGLELEVLYPPAPGMEQTGRMSKNNASLVLRLVKDGQGLVLAPGDAERRILRELARSGIDLTAKVLIVPHHGSASSLCPELYDAVKPAIAVVSCGAGNQWGFPNPAVRAALAERGIPLFSTSDFGQIRVRFNADGNIARLSAPGKDFPGARQP